MQIFLILLETLTDNYGADLVLSTKEQKIIVQAKRYKRKVGIKAVQEVASAKNHYKADECWVITNNYFTEPARKLAHSNEVKLIDRKQLMNWMLEMSRGA
ncbi:restriction endonuclease [Bacillus sp. FJAT-50079]|uniref:restriction endonuclease n=1 Tax=Bacillus sp. FJAT-50079 TaxID=2833577 RepID=UPI001BCA304A|nr:restriction endonuclease [Bacillus sp. FJAT-50079]MBS4206604.1 restriction endonuclease [Bacillus sp. FJAT-50079]